MDSIRFDQVNRSDSPKRRQRRLLRLALLVLLIVSVEVFSTSRFTLAFKRAVGTIPEYLAVSARVPAKGDEPYSPAGRVIPLPELVNTNVEKECKNGFALISDVILDSSLVYNRTIPRMVHITSKSRCVHPRFEYAINSWKFPNHAFFFHNEEAMDRLLNKDWPEFPFMRQAVQCIPTGAAKSDLWRALVVWEYGGIYTDMDNEANVFNGETLSDSDESFFVVEQLGVLSQYFFAAAPKHPLMWHIVHATMLRVYGVNDVDTQYAPFVTGPGGLKAAFIYFMQDQGYNKRGMHKKDGSPVPVFRYNRVEAGVYTGHNNWTVTVVGRKENANEYVRRNVVRRKDVLYTEMGMTHFDQSYSKSWDQRPEHCIQRLYDNMDATGYLEVKLDARIDNSTNTLLW